MGSHGPTTSGARPKRHNQGKYGFASTSCRPGNPYSPRMRAADAVAEAAIARLDALPASAFRRGPGGTSTRTVIEYRTGSGIQLRHYPVSPIGRPIMDASHS